MLLVDYLKGKENEEKEEVPAPSSDEEKNTENTGKTPLGIPKFIKTKKIGFRVPKANEMLFSANGTPITYPETQKVGPFLTFLAVLMGFSENYNTISQ